MANLLQQVNLLEAWAAQQASSIVLCLFHKYVTLCVRFAALRHSHCSYLQYLMQRWHCAVHKCCSCMQGADRHTLLLKMHCSAIILCIMRPMNTPSLDAVVISGATTFGFGTSQSAVSTPGFTLASQSAAAPAFGHSGPQSSPAPGSTFGFPQSQPAASSTAAFGFSPLQPAASSGFGFGQSQSQPAASSAASFGFGQAQSASGGFGFGQPPASSAAASTPGLFGQPAPQSAQGMHCRSMLKMFCCAMFLSRSYAVMKCSALRASPLLCLVTNAAAW